jgi:uncharacterized protein YdiU (UPF0061 family)
MRPSQAQFGWNFDNTYSKLPDPFFERVNPVLFSNPKLVLFNEKLAQELELNVDELKVQGQIYFSGQALFENSKPLALAYAGHQFGHFNMLGDGRAHLLGEHVTSKGEKFDIQLKGSGPTRFSRRGDGLAALGPMLREYVISEGMAALAIPTTRSLAVVSTGDKVVRESLLPGGVLTRVASSHIRVGTFQYAAALEDQRYLRDLADYTLVRHYPDLLANSEPYVGLLEVVIERQAFLVAQWMLVGFIHGVMNTDNMTLSGETIDYGPCAFMDRYFVSTVFSSIDREARYAYGQQPAMARWNLARLAEALLPLLDSDEGKAIAKAENALDTFSGHFQRHWQKGMGEKLGIEINSPEDAILITSLLRNMEKKQADYTNTFRALSLDKMPAEPLAKDSDFLDWYQKWQSRKPNLSLMCSKNPAVIPRNHLVEKALTAAVEIEDYSVIRNLLAILQNPYAEPDDVDEYTSPAPHGGKGYKTFCGT